MVYSTNSKHDMVNQTKLVVMKAYMLKNWFLEAQTVEMSVQNEGCCMSCHCTWIKQRQCNQNKQLTSTNTCV